MNGCRHPKFQDADSGSGGQRVRRAAAECGVHVRIGCHPLEAMRSLIVHDLEQPSCIPRCISREDGIGELLATSTYLYEVVMSGCPTY